MVEDPEIRDRQLVNRTAVASKPLLFQRQDFELLSDPPLLRSLTFRLLCSSPPPLLYAAVAAAAASVRLTVRRGDGELTKVRNGFNGTLYVNLPWFTVVKAFQVALGIDRLW